MSLDVQKMAIEGNLENMECILYGICVNSCPSKIIRFDFKKPRKTL